MYDFSISYSKLDQIEIIEKHVNVHSEDSIYADIMKVLCTSLCLLLFETSNFVNNRWTYFELYIVYINSIPIVFNLS